ncbi:MAG: prevent-host-death protein [Acidobacteria bacterium]|nr:prevent-host-death protein [Acidobacteriota bacterium]
MTTTAMKVLDLAADLPQMPVSDVKKRGWRAVMRTLTSLGSLAVTNHAEPEAVIMTANEYVRLLTLARATESRTEAALETLRGRFDERLATMGAADAGNKLRAVMDTPAKLRGRVKAGAGY